MCRRRGLCWGRGCLCAGAYEGERVFNVFEFYLVVNLVLAAPVDVNFWVGGFGGGGTQRTPCSLKCSWKTSAGREGRGLTFFDWLPICLESKLLVRLSIGVLVKSQVSAV
jgi:hypothetical protein